MVDEVTPDTPSSAWMTMSTVWDKIESVLGGTAAMRAKSEVYLPRHERERDENYRDRLSRAVLTNVSSQTLDSWIGRPFSDPVKLEEVPASIQAVLDDVDLQGNNVGVFARRWFREGLAKAFAHVLIDFPALPPQEAAVRTRADDVREQRRPYWSFVKPENLIFAASTVRNGKEILTHIRIRETEKVRKEWGEETVRRVRVFEHDPDTGVTTFSVWEPTKDGKEWTETTSATKIDSDSIPLVTFYADRQGLMVGKPPVEDLVDLNISHWQHGSDQDHILYVARFPILSVSGEPPEEVSKVVIGPDRILSTTDPQGEWYYTEHSGAAIEAGRQHIMDLEERMAHYGAEFLRRRPGSETATARALDSAEATSPLQDVAVRFNDALAQALALTAEWMKVEEPGRISIETDLGPEEVSPADLSTLTTARQLGQISRETYLAELKRRGVLADTFDAVEDKALIDAELMTGAAESDIDAQAEE